MTVREGTRRQCGTCARPVLLVRTTKYAEWVLDDQRLDDGEWGFTGGWQVGRQWWVEITDQPTPGHPRYRTHQCV